MDLSFKNKTQSYFGFDFCSMLETNKPLVFFNVSWAGWEIQKEN